MEEESEIVMGFLNMMNTKLKGNYPINKVRVTREKLSVMQTVPERFAFATRRQINPVQLLFGILNH
jgi:hypothetical protein